MLTVERPETETKAHSLVPDHIYVLKVRNSDSYGLYMYKGKNCLAIFSQESNAYRFGEHIQNASNFEAIEVSIEEAVEIAHSRPCSVGFLIILDSIQYPVLISLSEIV